MYPRREPAEFAGPGGGTGGAAGLVDAFSPVAGRLAADQVLPADEESNSQYCRLGLM
jgi:hypothetical protein